VRHRSKHLMLRVRVCLAAVLMLAVVFSLQRTPEASHGAWSRWCAKGHGGRIAIVVGEQAAGAVYTTRKPGHGLVYRDGSGRAVMGGALVPIARVAIPLAVSFAVSFLVATGHFFVLLERAMTFIHVAVTPVIRGRAATAVVVLVVHCLLGDFSPVWRSSGVGVEPRRDNN
jgi:hypothetical protein